jgi:hypothetical protein
MPAGAHGTGSRIGWTRGDDFLAEFEGGAERLIAALPKGRKVLVIMRGDHTPSSDIH